jgi:hypothetical protein
MHIRPNATIPAAILLAAIAVSLGTDISKQGIQAENKAGRLLAALDNTGQSALQQCREHVAIIHDVHWAAACMANAAEVNMKRSECLREEPVQGGASPSGPCEPGLEPPDDSPECTLPDARAFALNAARTAGDSRCLEEAAALERTASAPRPSHPQ